jgi:hypothetical protein
MAEGRCHHEDIAVPHREVRHAAPEPGGYEPIIQSGWRTSALMRIPDSRRTSREVRKVPILLQKSFWGDERNFLEALMRITGGDVRDHIVSSKIDQGSP